MGRLAARGSGEWLTEQNLADLRVTVLHAGHDLTVRAYSPRSGAHAGMGTGDLVGRALVDLLPELAGCEEELRAVARGETPYSELPLINRVSAEGYRTYLSLTILADEEIGGGLVLLVRDETERGQIGQLTMQHLNDIRLLQGELKAANARLVRLNAEKSDFVRMAAHDLRAPLAIIRGYVELVLQLGGPGLGAEIIECLGTVLGRSRLMADLIDALLDVEKIESGEVGLVLEPVNLSRLVEQAVESFRLQAEQKGLLLESKIPPGPSMVSADRTRLGQVLSNLLSNALKFTAAGGRVTAELAIREREAVVEVCDTGTGISDADQEHLFQRFFRADDARLRGTAGHGLGLPIARAIVEQHGGRIFFRSRLGHGSTFGFALPLP